MVFDNIKRVFAVESLKKKIIFVLLMTIVYKFLSVIPVPGANTELLSNVLDKSANSGLKFFGALMGGGLEHFSIILMGLSPYINALIILQLLGVIVPKIGELQKQGAQGQKVITKRTRWLTLPLAFVQSYGMIVLLNTLVGGVPIINTSDPMTVLFAMVVITTGTIFLVWIGEIITEYGIGNGISILITASVLSGVPPVIGNYLSKSTDLTALGIFLGVIILTITIIYIIIKFTEGNRKIPVIYSRTGREEKSYFPIKVNQAGMVPIIFAVSIITFPSIIGQILSNNSGEKAKIIGEWLVTHFSMNDPSIIFLVLYFLLVLGFAFFYVSITFNTENVAENIQKRGGYIPGIRPGNDTSEYLGKVSSHLNLYGGSFLALIAILPYVLSKIAGQSIDFIISGAGLIIIVSVILDIIRRIDSELKMFDYSKYK